MNATTAILKWSGIDEAQRERLLQRPTQMVSADVRAGVAAILERVRQRGDAALRELTFELDGVLLDEFAVAEEEFAAAEAAVPLELRVAMIAAAQRIEAFHEDGMQRPDGESIFEFR